MIRFIFLLALTALSDKVFAEQKPSISLCDAGKKDKEQYDFILDLTREDKLPHKYRAIGGPYAHDISKLDLTGFLDLRMSGSRQFSPEQLRALVEDLMKNHQLKKENIYIIDLREEAHIYLEDYSVALIHTHAEKDEQKFDIFTGIAPQDMEAFEDRLVKYLKEKGKQLIYEIDKKRFKDRTINFNVDAKNAKTEKEIVEGNGVHYQRFSVTDHKRPTDALMDKFVAFYKALPSDAWLHFHCRGGSGRTSSFMLIADIIKNGKKVPLEKIIERNIKMGGAKKLFDISQINSKKLHDGIVRRDFLLKFYEYVKDGHIDSMTWSQWIKNFAVKTKS